MRIPYILAVSIALASTSCQPSRVLRESEQVVHFTSSDSVLLVATGPIFSPNGDTGFMYEYHPYVSFDDTARLHRQALQLWRTVKPRAESLRAPFVVLRATTRLTEGRSLGISYFRNLGFVFEKRSNGIWYALYDSVPAKDP